MSLGTQVTSSVVALIQKRFSLDGLNVLDMSHHSKKFFELHFQVPLCQ